MVLSKLEQDILNLYQGENKEERDENSNKDARARAVKRNLAAGIVNRHFANLMLPEHIIQAHNNGRIHFHDNDFFLSRIVNCMLINLKDMLDNGTVLNDVLIEKPKSLLVAATVATQIIMSVADNCYGGKTIYLSDLSEYAQISRDKYKKWILDNGIVTTEQEAEHYADVRTDKEIQDAIQVIFYQLNTMMANGD
jgi:ribonucleoside-triphosphate reductase